MGGLIYSTGYLILAICCIIGLLTMNRTRYKKCPACRTKIDTSLIKCKECGVMLPKKAYKVKKGR